MATLSFNHIYKVYPSGTKAVNDFSMEIKDGEFVVFVGPSGCGKSTTLRMIAGLEEISNGELYIDNKMVNYLEPKNRDIAMVFQNYALYPHLNVFENIAFGLRLRHVSKEEINEKVNKAAEMLGLTEYLKSKPGAMSGGQRQRVALGRALVREPKVFLLDEPLSNLDAKLRASMRDEITKLHRKLKTTFIYVTHDQVEAMTMGDRIVVMKLGYIQQIDTPKDLYRYPCNKFVAGFIGTPQMNFTESILERHKDKIKLSFINTNTSFLIPKEYLYKVDPKYFDGKTVVSFALRSEYISTDPNKYPYKCKVKIANVEELGTESLIYANFDLDKDIGIIETKENENIRSNIAIKASADYEGKADDIIEISMDLSMLHLFDDDTEDVINPRVPTHSNIKAKVVGNEISLFGYKVKLASAFSLKDDEYDLYIPKDAISIGSSGHKIKVNSVEKINDFYLLTAVHGDDVLFIKSDKLIEKGKEIYINIDLKQVDFIKDGLVINKALPQYNEIKGMVYFHKEKKEIDGKMQKVKVLDYLIEEEEISISNPVAVRSFIENNDKTVYDLDLGFRFKIDQIHIVNDGRFEVKVDEILDYKDSKVARVYYKETPLYILLNEERVQAGDIVKVDIDLENALVYNLERDIRIV